MMKKSTIAVLAAALMLGGASIAQASDSGDYQGGFRIGPMGQRMGGGRLAFGFAGPRMHRYRDRDHYFAFVPGHHRVWRHERWYEY